MYTSAEELQRTLKPMQYLPPNLPRGFARFVYCRGYGENGLLDARIKDPPNIGTPQFWKIFFSCVNAVAQNENFVGILVSGTCTEEERIKNKSRLLVELRARGVWLVDASISALYHPGGMANPPPALRKEVLRTSWDMYTKRVVSDTAPEAILCIGKGVAEALRERLNHISIPWGDRPATEHSGAVNGGYNADFRDLSLGVRRSPTHTRRAACCTATPSPPTLTVPLFERRAYSETPFSPRNSRLFARGLRFVRTLPIKPSPHHKSA